MAIALTLFLVSCGGEGRDDSPGSLDDTSDGRPVSGDKGNGGNLGNGDDGNNGEAPNQDNENNQVLEHDGFTYITIRSPFTQKIWLDRNLGASKACDTADEAACFGDYYQWGRDTDGHEKVGSVTTDTVALDINNIGEFFIIGPSAQFNWSTEDEDKLERQSKWNAIDGSSACPAGFRVPTADEFGDETFNADTPVTDTLNVIDNFLKIPLAGYRGYVFGNRYIGESRLWTTSINDPVFIKYLHVSTTESKLKSDSVTLGFPVRCIKN